MKNIINKYNSKRSVYALFAAYIYISYHNCWNSVTLYQIIANDVPTLLSGRIVFAYESLLRFSFRILFFLFSNCKFCESNFLTFSAFAALSSPILSAEQQPFFLARYHNQTCKRRWLHAKQRTFYDCFQLYMRLEQFVRATTHTA